jgi:predicted thioesterase
VALEKGLKFKHVFRVTKEHSAKHLGSGDVEVLSTPSMILFMEEACTIVSSKYLPKELTTVGISVNIRHLKAAPVDTDIEIRAELLSVDGKRLTFWVEAWWDGRKIGQGIHERYIVNREDFINKLKSEVKKDVH